MLPLGYEFEIIEAIEFSRIKLFSDFIKHFYKIKKESTGATRFIAKLHLNTLYGYFGRKQDNISTITIKNSDLGFYMLNYRIKHIIKINSNYSSLLLIKENDFELHKYLDIDTSVINKLSNKKYSPIIMSNVAIASAVTSYARIHMIQFKNNENCFYSDTDSIITNIPLDNHLMGDELGLMKDEMAGVIIDKALFMGIKKYGYQYKDINGKVVDKSIISGVERDSISFKELENIFEGKTITINNKDKFYKNLTERTYYSFK